MDGTRRNQGLALTAVGLCVVVLAVLLFGLTTPTGDIDVINVIMAVAGAVMVATGLYQAFHHRRATPAR